MHASESTKTTLFYAERVVKVMAWHAMPWVVRRREIKYQADHCFRSHEDMAVTLLIIGRFMMEKFNRAMSIGLFPPKQSTFQPSFSVLTTTLIFSFSHGSFRKTSTQELSLILRLLRPCNDDVLRILYSLNTLLLRAKLLQSKLQN
ncbi:hypothetical protein Mp_4g03470 [Marchantia polymorpha subsp. ruderalis]|uniref:Uncharacterized protein n=2 Tax=Marchantia polymorpha TaxID=3197 RepID=A0AAF6B5V7_MARPO|nr:hypothetical protein MARPO_0044s0126 [Marchantia polymorpha]BBN07391.1 hypothetical protein Mp_4g03470 [Marchantia polymorpha subsp. ruderalis]|eukprot:PTQ39710.1 hypothetical protein MARPO_0044s0126 [Marchantia polymorpha]